MLDNILFVIPITLYFIPGTHDTQYLRLESIITWYTTCVFSSRQYDSSTRDERECMTASVLPSVRDCDLVTATVIALQWPWQRDHENVTVTTWPWPWRGERGPWSRSCNLYVYLEHLNLTCSIHDAPYFYLVRITHNAWYTIFMPCNHDKKRDECI